MLAIKLKIDPDWYLVLSELMINLSAGWLATVLIVPNLGGLGSQRDFLLLTNNLVFGTLSLVVAFKFRKLSR